MISVHPVTIARDNHRPTRLAKQTAGHTQLPSRFSCLGTMGEGGMGLVQFALDGNNGQTPVVIKRALRTDFNPHFANEAITLFTLPESPHLPQLIDHGLHNGTYWLAMPYIDGELLADRLDKGPLSLPESLKIVTQAAAGLAEANNSGILHRDLKPDNIMIGSNGITQVIDFGVAHVDQPGDLVGTVGYISPEQITDNDTIDCRSDIYSLGTIFYEMITGQPAFKLNRTAPILEQILTARHYASLGVPHLNQISLDLKEGGVQSLTQEFASKMTALDRADRYSNYQEVIAAAQGIGNRLAAFTREMDHEMELLRQATSRPRAE